MAMETQARAGAEPRRPEADASIIENEIPTYRAVSPLAVASALLGLGSLAAFIDPWFLVLAVLAVISGALADRKIQLYSDVLTGRKLAQAGLAMGLIFGLAVVTNTLVADFLLKRRLEQFSVQYLSTLQEKPLADAIWYRMPASSRRGLSSREVLARIQGAGDRSVLETQVGPTTRLKKRLDSGGKIRYDMIEQRGFDRLRPFGLVRLIVDGGKDEGPGEDSDDYALLELKGETHGSEVLWQVAELYYPYRPLTHVSRPKPVDDGHGHEH